MTNAYLMFMFAIFLVKSRKQMMFLNFLMKLNEMQAEYEVK